MLQVEGEFERILQPQGKIYHRVSCCSGPGALGRRLWYNETVDGEVPYKPSPRGEGGPRSGTDEVEGYDIIAAGMGEASSVHLISRRCRSLSETRHRRQLPLKGKAVQILRYLSPQYTTNA